MPTAPKRKKRPWISEPRQDAQSKRIYDTVYNTRRWQKLRAIQLAKQPLCEQCLKENKVTPATIADHIVPIKQRGEPWSEDNLQSLCEQCHNRKRQTERKN